MSLLTPQNCSAEDLARPEVIADPYPFYAALRPRSPLFGYRDLPPGTIPGTDEPPPSWAVLSHAQVTEVAKRADVFSSRDPLQEASGAPTLMLVNHDDPEHQQLRQRVQHFFVSSRLQVHREWLRATSARLLADIAGRDSNLMQGLAADLPAMMMTRILGMPLEDYPRFRRWATAFMLSAPLGPEQRMQSNADMFGYFTAKVTERMGQPADPDDLVSALLHAGEGEVELGFEEVVRFCFTLVVAGSETTTGLLGNLVWIAATQPAVYQQLRDNPALIERYIEEALRFAGPPQRLFRVATRDVELGGQLIRAGDWVAVFFAAANHDASVWPEPDRFLLDREQHRAHYSFGHGVHKCLGAMLVRLEAQALMEALVSRYAQVHPVSFARQTATQLSYALDDCSVRLESG